MAFSRHIVFIGGYDPKGGRRVYTEQKKQVALYNQRFGKTLMIGEVDTTQSLQASWQLAHPDAGAQAQFDQLQWDDLVRQRWARTSLAVVREAMASLWEFVTTGQLWKMWQLSRPLVYAAMLPYALALLAVGVPVLAGGLAAGLFGWITPQGWLHGLLGVGGLHWLQWAGAVAVGCGVGVLCLRKLRKAPVTWFLRVVAFARHYAHEAHENASDTSTPSQYPYRNRIQAWAKHLSAQLVNSPADEILIVGYSAGSILATGLLPQLARLLPPEQRSKLALLTLGNCVAVAACLPAADALRRDLRAIAELDIFWLDITSPTDWGSLHGVDDASRYAHMPASPQRLQISPRFHTLFTPASYAALRKDKYRVHQQYLQCTEMLGEGTLSYDYLALLCGPLTLHQRYGHTVTPKTPERA